MDNLLKNLPREFRVAMRNKDVDVNTPNISVKTKIGNFANMLIQVVYVYICIERISNCKFLKITNFARILITFSKLQKQI